VYYKMNAKLFYAALYVLGNSTSRQDLSTAVHCISLRLNQTDIFKATKFKAKAENMFVTSNL